MASITRRDALRAGLVLPVGLRSWPAGAFAAKNFWNERQPEQWTPAEVKELLSKSPWAKDAEVKDYGERGGLGSPRSVGRRGQTRTPGTQEGASPAAPAISWKAIVRWDSALPVRQTLKGSAPKGVQDFYVLNVIGNLPNAIPSGNDSEEQAQMAYIKDTTKLQHKGDEIHLSRLEAAPASDLSPAGVWFYFSRMLALMPEDKEAAFVTRIGPLEVKCKFTLKDMLYRGNLEL